MRHRWWGQGVKLCHQPVHSPFSISRSPRDSDHIVDCLSVPPVLMFYPPGLARSEHTFCRPHEADMASNGLVEHAVMLLHGVIRTIKCHVESCTQEELREDSQILPWLVEHAGSNVSRCQKGRDGRTPFERLHGKKPTQEFVPFGEKVLARPISSEPLNSMNHRKKFGMWLGVRNNSAECFDCILQSDLRVAILSYTIPERDHGRLSVTFQRNFSVPSRVDEFRHSFTCAMFFNSLLENHAAHDVLVSVFLHSNARH